MARSYVIGIMGPEDSASASDLERAEKLGALIAKKGWVTLTGGRPLGVMQAALNGAKKEGGQTIGILPGKEKDEACEATDIVIATGMNSGRNIINVLSSDVIVGCGAEAGTASEIALAIKEKLTTILITDNAACKTFFQGLAPNLVSIANTPEDVIKIIEQTLASTEKRSPHRE